MQLEYSDIQTGFYIAILEFVTFDLIPTEELYEAIFGLENIPYSDSAESIGYESRYIVMNSGSLFIYIFATSFAIILLAIVKACAHKGSKLHSYSITKLTEFKWAGFTDFLNEIYLPMSYIVFINSSALSADSLSVFFMSVFCSTMSLVLICWPFYLAIKVYKALATRPVYPIVLQGNIEIMEGGEPEVVSQRPSTLKKSKKKKKKLVKKKKTKKP